MAFVNRIIAGGHEESIRYSLTELKNILEKEGLSEELTDFLDGLIISAPEAAELAFKKKGAEAGPEELARVIREGRERKRRQDAFRC